MANQSIQFRKVTALPSTLSKGCVYFNSNNGLLYVATGTSSTSYQVFGPTVSTHLTSGTKIATIKMGAESYDLYCETNTDTDTKVTSAANHYVPSTNSSYNLSKDASSTTSASWGSTSLVTGVNITRDSRGHVIDMSLDSIKIPSNPNTDYQCSESGHYAPSGSAKTGTASGTLSFGSAVVTGMSFDSKGHVTGFTTSNLPANPNTDTKNTTGADNTTSKIFLVGSTSQTSNNESARTYSNSNCYASGGYLYSGGTKVLTTHQDISGKADKSSLATVATSGSYNDLTNKPTIPTVPTSLKNPHSLSFGSNSYDGSSAKTITAADLGLDAALKFHGTSTTAITDGSTTKTVTLTTGVSHTAENGCVLFYGNKEFVWNGSSWEELGNEGDYKVKQTAVSSPSASGSATAFIDTISQDANGNISVTKKNVQFPTNTNYYPSRTYTSGLQISTGSGSTSCTLYVPEASENQSGVISTSEQTFTGEKVFSGGLRVGENSASSKNDVLYNKIIFGDGTFDNDVDNLYCAIGEYYNGEEEDCIAITGSNGIYLFGQVNAISSVYASAFYQSSDERLKNFKNDIPVDLEKLSKLPKKYFTWKSDEEEKLQIGTSAQAVRELYPELVNEDKKGNLSVAYDKLSIVALKAVDELYNKNKELEARLERLEKLLIKE